MELLNNIKKLGFFIIIGILLIVIAGMVVVYIQNSNQQETLAQQIDQLNITLKNPAPDNSQIVSEFKQIESFFAPPSLETVIEILLLTAEANGIDVNPEIDGFVIPQQDMVRESEVGKNPYQTLVLDSITLRGEFESIMGFIGDLESGDQINTLVIRAVDIRQVDSPESIEYRAVMGISVYFLPESQVLDK